MRTLHVEIGTWKADYVVVETTAPQSYDAASSITIYEDGRRRWVAIEAGQLDWYLGRYSSGLYARKVDETFPLPDLQTKLVEHLLGFERFLRGEGPAAELVDRYGFPERGMAGGYLAAPGGEP